MLQKHAPWLVERLKVGSEHAHLHAPRLCQCEMNFFY